MKFQVVIETNGDNCYYMIKNLKFIFNFCIYINSNFRNINSNIKSTFSAILQNIVSGETEISFKALDKEFTI